jgi:hypothetical protein
MADTPERPPTERELRELAAFADGSLAPERRAALEERIAASPRLQALLADQQCAVAAIRAHQEPAPPALRTAVADAIQRGRREGRAHPFRLAAGFAAAATVVVLAVLLALPGSDNGAPSIAKAAKLSTFPPERPAPGAYPRHPGLLDLEVEEVPYPDWRERFGWRAVGSRADRVDGRNAVTLFYTRAGRRIGYTILAGGPVKVPDDARRIVLGDTVLASFNADGRTVVTWQRKHHTCVLSGAGVSREALLKLGAWKGDGAIPY